MTKVTIIIHEGRGGRPHGRRALEAQPGSEMEHGPHRHHGRHRRPDHELSAAELAQRQLARRLRRDVRRVLREAEAAGLSPERAARVARRETRREDYR